MATRLCTHQDDVALTKERQLQELPGKQRAGARPDQLEKAIRQTSPPLSAPTPGSLDPWCHLNILVPSLNGQKVPYI